MPYSMNELTAKLGKTPQAIYKLMKSSPQFADLVAKNSIKEGRSVLYDQPVLDFLAERYNVNVDNGIETSSESESGLESEKQTEVCNSEPIQSANPDEISALKKELESVRNQLSGVTAQLQASNAERLEITRQNGELLCMLQQEKADKRDAGSITIVEDFDGLKAFENNEFGTLRVIRKDEDGSFWFVAADVCRALDIGNSRQALTRLDEDEKGVISNDTPGGRQEMSTVNEPGLYSLVLSSRKPEAKAFKRWITHEVIPTIRKTGEYSAPMQKESRAVLPEPSKKSLWRRIVERIKG